MGTQVADALGLAVGIAKQHEVGAEHRDLDRRVGQVFAKPCDVPDIRVHVFLRSGSIQMLMAR